MSKLTKKHIFKQKLKGEPIKIPWSNIPWLEEIKHIDLLVECDILKEAGKGRFVVCYPIMMYGSYSSIPEENRKDKWTTLQPGARLCNLGDLWDL